MKTIHITDKIAEKIAILQTESDFPSRYYMLEEVVGSLNVKEYSPFIDTHYFNEEECISLLNQIEECAI